MLEALLLPPKSYTLTKFFCSFLHLKSGLGVLQNVLTTRI